MYKGKTQVYRSTYDQLATSMARQGIPRLSIEYKRMGDELKLVFLSEDQKRAFDQALGDSWIHSKTAKIEREGNYQCVLRNNHVVHVQAIRDTGDLRLTCATYSQPLEHLADDQVAPMPPVDFDEHYRYSFTDGMIAIEEATAETGNVFVTMLAGPYIDCRLPIVMKPKGLEFDDNQWRTLSDRLVNQVAERDCQIVWWRAISAPPHYTREMIEGDN